MPAPSNGPNNLTGEVQFRETWYGKIVLQCEERVIQPDMSLRVSPFVDRRREVLRWRDATARDLPMLRYLATSKEAAAKGEPPPPPPPPPDW